MDNFVAIDFETANGQRSSVCSVGIVIVKDGQMVDNFYSLIKPFPNYYSSMCQDVHGLGHDDTDTAPEFPDVWVQVMNKIHEYYPFMEDGQVPFVAHNSPFDEGCLRAVFAAYEIRYPDYVFQCTCRKSRQVWPNSRHNLDVIAGYCGYDLKHHHHALADAEACAVIGIQIL